MTAAHGTGLQGGGGPGSGPPVVFVSYCRQAAEWLRRFEVMLKPEVREAGRFKIDRFWPITTLCPCAPDNAPRPSRADSRIVTG
jgi:hypothetical protein